jgi:hypothetical protein
VFREIVIGGWEVFSLLMLDIRANGAKVKISISRSNCGSKEGEKILTFSQRIVLGFFIPF